MMRRTLPVVVAGLFSGLFVALPAAAHIRMDFPIGRYSDDFLKAGPCGKGSDDGRSSNVNTFEPGATIDVRFTETVGHQGFYRVAFDEDGADAADFENPDNELAKQDDAAGGTGTEYKIEVKLPDVECDNCTLQLIQDMGGGVYFQCADLVLKKGAGNDEDGGGAGCSSTGSAAPMLGALALGLVARRRRSRR
jgi:MYXO-CTERM domain-containing protein